MKHLLYIIALLPFVACTEIVDVDLDEAGDPVLVVFGEFTDELKVQEVQLSLSQAYLDDNSPVTVDGARLRVHNSTDTLELVGVGNGLYITPIAIAIPPSVKYTLLIDSLDIDGDGIKENYTASDEALPVTHVDSIVAKGEEGEDYWSVGIYGQEPGDEDNFYCFRVYLNAEDATPDLEDWWATTDELFNGSDLNGTPIQFIGEDDTEFPPVEGDTVTLRMSSISEAYTSFLMDAQTEAGEKIPIFSGPPANVIGNISNGALGFFSVQSVNYASGVYQVEED